MNSNKYFELSNPQQRIWFTELLNNRKDMSNIGYLIELREKYDLERLAQAIKHVVRANDGLHLRFKYSDKDKSKLLQYLPDYEDIDVAVIETTTEKELYEKIEALHRERYDVTRKSLCSFAVFSINKERYGFFEKAHHMVADGISATVVAREVIDTYEKLERGEFEEINKEYSYMDFLEDEKEYVAGDKYNKSKEYWVKRFEDFEGRDVTFALNKNVKNSLKVKRRSFQIPEHMIDTVEDYKTNNRMSNFGLFMAAMAVYFHRFMNHEDIVIGMPVHNRAKKIFKNMVGMFVSTVPLRITFRDNWSFNELIADIKKGLWDSLKHQSYPYNHLVKDLKDINIDASGFLNVQLIELPGSDDEYTRKRAFFSTANNISQVSIYLNQQNTKNLEDLDIAVDYHADLFEEREVEEFFKRLMVILEQCINEPDTEISQMSLLDAAEYDEVVVELNRTQAPYPADKTLHRLFEEQVVKNPAAIALEYEGQEVTYGELDDLTAKLAAKLQAAGVAPGAVVGMLCERSIEAVVSILAVLKAGGAYVPIDPEYPLERKNYIIKNSRLGTLLVEKILEERESELLGNIPETKSITVDYQTLKQEEAADFKAPAVTPDHPAYIIYTSGTTGNPKGTLLRHRNVINYIWWGAGHYVKGETVTFPLFTSLSFDLTVTSIFIPLVTGNKIVIYRDYEDGILLERVVRENKVDLIKLTPSHLKIIKEFNCRDSKVKTFIVGGEELKTAVAGETDDYFTGDIKIYNEYGPTETAVGCMIHLYDPNSDTDLAVPIGKPSGNVKIYILDKNKRPLPVGIVGEIYIGGAGVAAGYLNNKELTDEKFVDNPFVPGETMYRSGDLGRWNPDRILEFFGRCDEQVKIRGYRIEPGEIEKHLVKIDGISDAVVALRKGTQTELSAYIVVKDQDDIDVTFLRDSLSADLPVYMLPSEYVLVDNIPLTRNGKVDHRKLQTMGTHLASSREYVAPRDEMETLLADIWTDVLGAEKVGVTDNFFELGGDSIKAVQITARLNDVNKTVNVKDILSHQTIAAVCANVDFDSHIRQYEQGVVDGDKGLTPIESWFLSRGFTNPNHYNQSVLLEFKASVDIPVMEKAMGKLIEQHDGLRLNYNPQKNLFYFNNDLLDKSFKIEVVDMSDVPESERAAFIEEKGYEAKGRFDLTYGLLINAVLFRGGNAPDRMLLTLHHVIVDGLTWRTLLEGLYDIYEALRKGDQYEPPRKTASLLDWYDALVLYRDSGKLEDEREYWADADAADFSLPYDTPASDVDWSLKNQETVDIQLDKDETADLFKKDIHEVYKTDTQILITTALVRTLRQWTRGSVVTVEMESHGRSIEGHSEDLDTSKTAGWFTAMYPLLVNRETKTIGDEIKVVKEAVRRVPNNGIGYGILKYMTGDAPGFKRTEVRFNYLGQFDREVENPLFSYCELSTGSDVALENHMTAGVEINAMVLNGVFSARINYNREAFEKGTMVSFGAEYIKNLSAILEHIKKEDDVHFTTSDFDTVDMDEDDLAALFE
jgi:amino acid adenylation domain-containing protein/non-ribosomal peptide synthase protein (TIGR01720 family)